MGRWLNWSVVGLVLGLVLGASALKAATGAGAPAAETPQQSLDKIIALLEAKDHKTLVGQYYEERTRFSQAELDKLIERLDSGMGQKLLVAFKQIRDAKPVVKISDDGKRATFQIEGKDTLVLYKDGEHWGFHL